MTPITVPLSNPNWRWPNEDDGRVGFALRLNIIQPSEFDDEPTIPYGLVGDANVDEDDE